QHRQRGRALAVGAPHRRTRRCVAHAVGAPREARRSVVPRQRRMKIFIATGTQLAFARLVTTVDEWAAEHPEAEIFAQVGPSGYRPQHMQSQAYMAPQTFERRSKEADLIIAHAGTGTIFTALELRKPIIVMPRLHEYGEHRNDHQVATVERFKKLA